MLKKAIADALVVAGILDAGSWELSMAEPAADAVTKKGDPANIAADIVAEMINAAPPEIAGLGRQIGYLHAFGYNTKRQFLLDAIGRVNAK